LLIELFARVILVLLTMLTVFLTYVLVVNVAYIFTD